MSQILHLKKKFKGETIKQNRIGSHLACETIIAIADRTKEVIDVIFKDTPTSAIWCFAMERVSYFRFSLGDGLC